MDDKSEKRVGILGAGWLGFALTQRLLLDGVQVHAASTSLDKREEVRSATNARCFVVDLPEIVPKSFFVGLTHLVITIPPGGRKLGAAATEIYSDRLSALFPILQDHEDLKIIFCSSTGVYGSTLGSVNEETPVNPDTHSGRAVVAAEALLEVRIDQLTILRFGGLFGPGRHPGHFFGGKNFPLAQADAPVNLISQADAVSAIIHVINEPRARGVYNVCAAAHPSKGAFYGAAAGAVGLGIAAILPGGKDGKLVDSSKLRTLGWAPKNDNLSLDI